MSISQKKENSLRNFQLFKNTMYSASGDIIGQFATFEKDMPDRLHFSKLFWLYCRCLAEAYLEKVCPKRRQCGPNGCQKLHNRLLHKTDHLTDVTRPSAGDLDQTETNFVENAEQKVSPLDPATLIGGAITFGIEGTGKN